MSVAWLAAALCVGAMGIAIQRGSTCCVAAVDELLTQGRAQRLLAILEASLWVAGGLVLAQLSGLTGSLPAAYPIDGRTVAGGTLLGLGAWVNRACAFGTVARLGSGEWAYLATPAGFYAGCLSAGPHLFRAEAAPASVSLDEQAAPLLALAFGVFALWRMQPVLQAMRRDDGARWLRRSLWAPHAATIVIGVSFVLTLLFAGRWTYTDLLADLALKMGRNAGDLALALLLLAALSGGALAAGWTSGGWRAAPRAAGSWLRCFTGGLLMAWGSLLVPGSNDGLILIGFPLLQPHAWLALASMFASISVAMLVERAWKARRPRPS